jgi:hypothetical protein
VDRNKVVLVDALPALLRLTALYLGGAYCAESALGQVSRAAHTIRAGEGGFTCAESAFGEVSRVAQT